MFVLMQGCGLYIADLADYFVGDSGYDEFGGVYPISPVFPPVGSPVEAVGSLICRIESGKLYGRKVDRDCWVAIMTPEEIAGYIDELYDFSWYKGIGAREHVKGQLNDLLEALIRLDPNEKYALVVHKM